MLQGECEEKLSTVRLHSLQAVIPGFYRTSKAHTGHVTGFECITRRTDGARRTCETERMLFNIYGRETIDDNLTTCIRGRRKVVRRALYTCWSLHSHRDNKKDNSLLYRKTTCWWTLPLAHSVSCVGARFSTQKEKAPLLSQKPGIETPAGSIEDDGLMNAL